MLAQSCRSFRDVDPLGPRAGGRPAFAHSPRCSGGAPRRRRCARALRRPGPLPAAVDHAKLPPPRHFL